MTTEFGQWAESQAANYLRSREYSILDRNYRKKWGEIDIVATKNDILIFVEVKANKEEVAGFEPELRVTREKIKRMTRTILTYLSHKKYSPETDWQIDILTLVLDRNRGLAKIKHYKNIEV